MQRAQEDTEYSVHRHSRTQTCAHPHGLKTYSIFPLYIRCIIHLITHTDTHLYTHTCMPRSTMPRCKNSLSIAGNYGNECRQNLPVQPQIQQSTNPPRLTQEQHQKEAERRRRDFISQLQRTPVFLDETHHALPQARRLNAVCAHLYFCCACI